MELIFPSNIYCISCNEPISRKNKWSFCKKCYNNIEFLKEKNIIYDTQVSELLKNKNIKEIRIATVYNDVMKSLIHKIKFSNKTYLSKYLANILYDTITSTNLEFDYIFPVPINKKRLETRGYNQVELIVKHLSYMTNKPIIDVAKRIKNTQSMYELDLKQRHNEMKDAFESIQIKELENKTLLIVDDILTTGATVSSLVKSIIKNNKNTNIKLVFISRGVLK